MSKKTNNSLRLFSCINAYKFFNLIKLHTSYWLSVIIKKPIHWGSPASLSIEPCNICNLRCPECPAGSKMLSRPKGCLSFDSFVKNIDVCKKTLVHLFLYFQGEPYLNPDFFNMVRYAKKQKIYVATSTNGHFLDDANAKNTIKSGLDKLIISLDGLDADTYTAYRSGGDLEKVLSGIKNLIAYKKKTGSKTPFVELQFLVLRSNEHQLDEVKKLATELGVDKLSLKTAQLYDFKNGHPLMPKQNKYSRYKEIAPGKFAIKSKLKNRCFRMWSSGVITWNGELVPCCFDKDCSHAYGNINEEPFQSLWKGKKAKNFHARIFSSRKSIPICCNCIEGLRI